MPEITCPHCKKTLLNYDQEHKSLSLFDSLGLVRIINRKNYLIEEMEKIDSAIAEFIKRVDRNDG